MTPTKLLIGQILVVFAIVVAGVWAATQWCASMLGYQPQLGEAWFTLAGLPFYRPWSIFWWWYSFEAYAPEVFDKAGTLAGASGFLGCAAAIGGSLWRSRQAKFVTTYGSARWAKPSEIERAGLHRDAGVFLGRLGGRYLRHDGPEHVMAFAPTRSGKGVGLVVPTLLSWTGSAVIHDIKGENWQLTAGWRSLFSHALLFNPTDPASAHYNPLLEVRRGEHEVRDVQNVADILVDPEGALERRSHWEKTSHSLLVGAILHVLYAEEEKTLARVATFLSDPQRPFVATLRRMMTTNHLGTKDAPRVHPVIASSAREVLNKSENERSGVLSTAMSFLGLYRDPTVAEVTSRCDWRIADLVEAERPVSLYLVIPPSDISRTKPLIRLVLNQIGRRLTERLDGGQTGQRKHQLLMMLDEFPALGRLDFFETALAFMAGYGVRAFLIAQSLNQIEKAYGEHNSILDNCHVRVAAEQRSARESGVMIQLGSAGRGGVAAPPNLPAGDAPATGQADAQPGRLLLDPERDPNNQQRRLDFVASRDASGDINPHALTPAASPYTLHAGSVISASLITGLNSDLPGLVTAQVTENAYDTVTGRTLLIPQGSRLIGSYDSVVAFGQSRALVVWQRIILPDGSSIRIDNVPATDLAGYAGLSDRIDRHTWQLLKGVALSTLLGVGTELSFGSTESDLVRAIRESAQQSGARAGDQLVTRNLNVQPTLRVRPGWPLRVVVHKDVVVGRPWRAAGAAR